MEAVSESLLGSFGLQAAAADKAGEGASIELRDGELLVGLSDDEEAPVLGVAAGRGLRGNLDAGLENFGLNGAVEVEAAADGPGSPEDFVEGVGV